jgi:O-antigen ligase
MLNDKYRGIDSGFSGRGERWIYGISVWFENFFIGVGYGNSVEYIGFSLDNAYLTILVELGLVGMLLYLSIIVISIKRAIKFKLTKKLLFIIIYLLYGLFEKRYFSIGNSFSILYLFTIYAIFIKRRMH